jgi:C4-dicarboxylate-specific signal transduction histidine kinase
MIYLENHLAPGVFTPERTTMTQILASQAAVSIEMARLYSELLAENANRTDIEFALRKARVELAQTSHLTVMGELAASISHEINQPLASILALSSAGVRWLQRSEPDVGEALETFHELEVAANRAAGIVSSLRSLAKQTPPALTSLSIYQIVEDVLRITAGDVEANKVVVEARLQCAQHTVHGDPIQLQQVVLNLITNAIDAMEATPISERRLTVGSALEDGFVKISVGDAGKGLPQGDAERIFGAMFTTKEKGMGMGLAICRSIIQSHGGQIGAVQRERGTELWFTLPLRTN